MLATHYHEIPDGGEPERARELLRGILLNRFVSTLDRDDWPVRTVRDEKLDCDVVEVGPPPYWRYQIRALESALEWLVDSWPHGDAARAAARARRAVAAFRRRWAK